MSTGWKQIADLMASRLANHACCDEHPKDAAEPGCPFCSDRTAYFTYLAAGGTDYRPRPTGRVIGLEDLMRPSGQGDASFEVYHDGGNWVVRDAVTKKPTTHIYMDTPVGLAAAKMKTRDLNRLPKDDVDPGQHRPCEEPVGVDESYEVMGAEDAERLLRSAAFTFHSEERDGRTGRSVVWARLNYTVSAVELDKVLALLPSAQRIAWQSQLDGHDLVVIDALGRVFRYSVSR